MSDRLRDGEGVTIPVSRTARTNVDIADAEDLVRRANAAVAALKARYPQAVQRHLDGLEAACGIARADPSRRRAQIEAIAGIAHDVKGEGESYGYRLMTSLGASLYRFASGIRDGSEVELDIVEMHVDAMRAVIRDRLEGDGGDVGATLVAALDEAIAKFDG